jgi:hypothetical protein
MRNSNRLQINYSISGGGLRNGVCKPSRSSCRLVPATLMCSGKAPQWLCAPPGRLAYRRNGPSSLPAGQVTHEDLV